MTAASDIEIVVARFREDPSWTRNVPAGCRVTIYDKGGDLDPAAFPRARIRRLENRGVEAQTYLRHVLDRYDDPAPVTVFCQGRPFDHAHDLHKVLRAMAAGEGRPAPFRWLGFTIDSDDPRGRRLFVPWSKNRDGRELDLGRFYRVLFGRDAPAWTHFYLGAQFAIRGDLMRRRPRAFFRRAEALSRAFPDAGHCFERTWDRVFGVRGVDPALLGGRLVRYLKPIRRLGLKKVPARTARGPSPGPPGR